MSKAESRTILRAVLEELQRGGVIPPSALQQVRSLSEALSQLLENYNRRLANNEADSLRKVLISRVKHEMDACAVTENPNSNQRGSETARVRREVSQKKLIANRRNSGRSTGPRTRRGKRAVRYNALKHGLFCEQIPGEDLEKFENLRLKLRSCAGSGNWVEERLVSNAALLTWKLERCIPLQESLLSTNDSSARWRTIVRYQGSLHRQLRGTIQELSVLQQSRKVLNK